MIYKNTTRQPGDCTEIRADDETPRIPACLICQGETKPRFCKTFAGTNMKYCHCSRCGHLTATGVDANPNYSEIDTGREERNERMFGFIRILSRLPAIRISKATAILDFGCGSGRLVQDLNQAGFDAFGFEPHPEARDCSRRVFADLREIQKVTGVVELVTCIEVFEHLRQPDDALGRISDLLRPSGYLLVSTDLYNHKVHTEHWYYLNPAGGHVSIFSETSLKMLLRRHGFYPVLRINSSVWLFRKAGTSPQERFVERTYLALSQARVRVRMLQTKGRGF
jgi:SAM-dependent methyltransferase